MNGQDPVNRPEHYTTGPFECILLTEQYSFNVGNCLKYVWRHQSKGHPVEDLRKARWYANRANLDGESFAPCVRRRPSTDLTAESAYDPATLCYVKANSTTPPESEFWELMASQPSGRTVITQLDDMIAHATKETQ